MWLRKVQRSSSLQLRKHHTPGNSNDNIVALGTAHIQSIKWRKNEDKFSPSSDKFSPKEYPTLNDDI